MLKPIMLSVIIGLNLSFVSLFAQETAEAEQQEAVQQDEQTIALTNKLLGSWGAASLQMGPNPAPPTVVENISFVFTEEALTISGLGPEENECEYVIDASQTPATIKFKPTEETNWVAGIVKLEEDGTATMCLAPPGDTDLPKTFETGADTPRLMLAVLKKQ